MIDYEFGEWGIGFIFQRSSVFKRAACIATYPLTLALTIGSFLRYSPLKELGAEGADYKNALSLFGTWSFVLTFLLVFRTQIAYGRYWDGITSLQNVRGVWFNACSNLISFTSVDPAKQFDVISFQHLLVRLMSLLYCTALQEVAVMEDENFGIIGDEGIQLESLVHLANSADRLEVVMQWIQRLIVDNHLSGVLPIAPPILSRVFQELSNGIVKVQDAMKISEYPFPFPFAQMLTVLLCGFTCSSPVVFAFVIEWPFVAAILAWAVNFSFWSINYIAAEIEMPFGDDPNDLPIRRLQDIYNRKLVALMHPLTQNAPAFSYDCRIHDSLVPQEYRLMPVARFSVGSIEQAIAGTGDGNCQNGQASGSLCSSPLPSGEASTRTGLESISSESLGDYRAYLSLDRNASMNSLSSRLTTRSTNRLVRRGYHWKEINGKHWEQRKSQAGLLKKDGLHKDGNASEAAMVCCYNSEVSTGCAADRATLSANQHLHGMQHNLRQPPQAPRSPCGVRPRPGDLSPMDYSPSVSSMRTVQSPAYQQVSPWSSIRSTQPSQKKSQKSVIIGEHEEIIIQKQDLGESASHIPTDEESFIPTDGPPGPMLTAGRYLSPFFHHDLAVADGDQAQNWHIRREILLFDSKGDPAQNWNVDDHSLNREALPGGDKGGMIAPFDPSQSWHENDHSLNREVLHCDDKGQDHVIESGILCCAAAAGAVREEEEEDTECSYKERL